MRNMFRVKCGKCENYNTCKSSKKGTVVKTDECENFKERDGNKNK